MKHIIYLLLLSLLALMACQSKTKPLDKFSYYRAFDFYTFEGIDEIPAPSRYCWSYGFKCKKIDTTSYYDGHKIEYYDYILDAYFNGKRVWQRLYDKVEGLNSYKIPVLNYRSDFSDMVDYNFSNKEDITLGHHFADIKNKKQYLYADEIVLSEDSTDRSLRYFTIRTQNDVDSLFEFPYPNDFYGSSIEGDFYVKATKYDKSFNLTGKRGVYLTRTNWWPYFKGTRKISPLGTDSILHQYYAPDGRFLKEEHICKCSLANTL